MLKTAIALAAACAGACPQAQTRAEAAATELPELTNTATRGERRVDEVPATVGVFKPKAGARDLRELLRDEVDLAVRAPNPRFSLAASATGRAGNEGINIRGLEGNQVLMLVDGIRMPQAFSFGPFATGRAGLLNLEGAQQLEVLRGPASTQFGSDGLAGALAVRTLRAGDLLKPGHDFGLRAQASAYGGDDGAALNLAGAWRSGGWDWLLQGATRRSHELANKGTVGGDGAARTRADPLDRARNTLLAKAGYRLNAQQRLEATLEGVRQRDQVEVLSARSATTLDLKADDRSRRGRASLAWTLDDPNAEWLQQAGVQVYHQDSRVAQYAFEDRTSTARSRDNRYDETLTGLSATGQIGWGAQRVTLGLDASRNTMAGLRDGTTASVGDTLPSKPFPDTGYRLVGAFVQGEFTEGDWQFLPALRYEHFSLKPSADGYGAAIVELGDSAVTPRIGAVWKAAPGLAPYAQWARGFKAPTPSQVNSGFSNPAQGYKSIGNPNLKAERADSRELGLRGELGGWRWQLAAFDNRYDDFIQQTVVAGAGTTADPLVFQSVNLDEARIRGMEARLSGQLDRQWRLGLAYARTRGDYDRKGVRHALDTVEPAKASASLRQQRAAWHWEATVLRAQGKAASRVDATNPFLPKGYTVLDLTAGWQITPVWSLQARVDNLTDRTYWRWADVRGLAATSAALDAYTAPGRQFGLVLQAQL
ncbi:TonB-dependent receptor domain-containing protein [Pelomonas aquatica]|uniref:TonB-dependent receptor n=1 Tax=Pelomonas aquatica TaxID=431058 RepID=A0A9X4LEE6_9BURK|nr:TonB-dependent receptor [Pelomonas aquatica]MCY4754737.1 TonB-dependent receptor [Pelomonas aquatica]MDG0861950.1 TonB-dependent receptor [Pelomonas aquatica]